jgi:hypothetical protein
MRKTPKQYAKQLDENKCLCLKIETAFILKPLKKKKKVKVKKTEQNLLSVYD